MKKKYEKFQKEYEEFNKNRRGRPIKLNRKTLKTDKDYAELLFFGDLHLGNPRCDLLRAKDMLNWALSNKVYVFLMGDLIDANIKNSVGTGIYEQVMSPDEQMQNLIELLSPLANSNLIIGAVRGNHEERIRKETSIDIMKVISNILHFTYLGYSGWSLLTIGKEKYSLYTTHGVGGSRFKHTKLKKVVDMSAYISADIIASGHYHSLVAEPIIRQEVDFRTKQVVERKSYVVITGSYLEWAGSYAEAMQMPPGKLGSPKCRLSATEHNFHFSL